MELDRKNEKKERKEEEKKKKFPFFRSFVRSFVRSRNPRTNDSCRITTLSAYRDVTCFFFSFSFFNAIKRVP